MSVEDIQAAADGAIAKANEGIADQARFDEALSRLGGLASQIEHTVGPLAGSVKHVSEDLSSYGLYGYYSDSIGDLRLHLGALDSDNPNIVGATRHFAEGDEQAFRAWQAAGVVGSDETLVHELHHHLLRAASLAKQVSQVATAGAADQSAAATESFRTGVQELETYRERL